MSLLLGDGDQATEDRAIAAQEITEDEWPFTVERIPLASMFADFRYQRPAEERFIAGMETDFDETLVGAIDVSDREGVDVARGELVVGVEEDRLAEEPMTARRYAILDGQQRWEVMKRVGKTTAYAAVFTGMDLPDEAGFFYRKNKDRRTMQGYYGFRARVVAGDLEALAVQDAVQGEGFELGPVTDHDLVIGSIAAVQRAWGFSSAHRDESLTPTLATLREVWRGQNGSLQASVIVALALFWRRFPDEEVSRETLKIALESFASPMDLIERGREKRAPGLPLADTMTSVIVETYNRRRSGPPLIEENIE